MIWCNSKASKKWQTEIIPGTGITSSAGWKPPKKERSWKVNSGRKSCCQNDPCPPCPECPECPPCPEPDCLGLECVHNNVNILLKSDWDNLYNIDIFWGVFNFTCEDIKLEYGGTLGNDFDLPPQLTLWRPLQGYMTPRYGFDFSNAYFGEPTSIILHPGDAAYTVISNIQLKVCPDSAFVGYDPDGDTCDIIESPYGSEVLGTTDDRFWRVGLMHSNEFIQNYYTSPNVTRLDFSRPEMSYTVNFYDYRV